MTEDKLTPEQRLRLECLAQANSMASPDWPSDKILTKARAYEAYVKNG